MKEYYSKQDIIDTMQYLKNECKNNIECSECRFYDRYNKTGTRCIFKLIGCIPAEIDIIEQKGGGTDGERLKR